MRLHASDLFPDETPDIYKEVGQIVQDPDHWLDMPNDQLGGRKPKELIGTDQEQHLRDLLRAIRHGMTV